MPAKLRSLVQGQKPDIRISFENPKKTYTTLDRIEGIVTIVAPVDTPFEDITVEFIGTSRTYVERLTTAAAATGRSEAFHQFLRLNQPDVEQDYPEDYVLRAGVSYQFPFIFAVPQQLLPRCCQHKVSNDATREAHLHLPPTFGDKDLTIRQKSLDDGAPDMANVRYGVFARITELKSRNDEIWKATVASKARRVRVIPATETQPPLDVHIEDGDYVMRREKQIRKGMLKGKAGTLVMEAAQPQALQVRSYDNPEARSNSMATIMLRYDPLEENTPPPKVSNLSSKLKITTYFASTARHRIPSKTASLTDMSQGLHTEQFNLSSRCMANVEWVKNGPSEDSTPLARRDSATSMSATWTGATPEPSENYKGKTYYTACLVVPIQLPTNRAFVPTFHSCLISRVYALKFDLNISSVGMGPTMDLKLPVQISTEGLVGDEFERRGSVGSITTAIDTGIEIDDETDFFTNYFEPRRIRIPSDGFIGRSRIGSQAPIDEDHADAPPGYYGSSARIPQRSMSVPVY